MKKIVLTLYTSHNARPEIPFSDLKYQWCYEVLYSLGETLGLHFCRAPISWYDTEKDEFCDSWEFVDGTWRRSGPIKPDLVYDKTSSRSDGDKTRELIIARYRFMDDPSFTRFANDKYKVSLALPQYFKPYQKFSNADDFGKFLTQFTGDRLVIKPVRGSGGHGVHIASKAEAAALTLTFPVIVQEFIDSSKGIPGITDTYHDLRMVFIGDELVYSYVRTPKEGSLLANLAQGGSMTIVSTENLPQSLQPIIRDTQKLFAKFPQKTYTIDVLFDETSRPWIIEYNTMPGMFFPPEEEPTMRRVYTRFLQEFKKFLETPQPITVVIISTPREHGDGRSFDTDQLREAYTRFSEIASREAVRLYRASTELYDVATESFRMAWHWDGNDWVIAHSVVPDVIYDKAAITPETTRVRHSLAKRFPIVNHPEFSVQAGNKLAVSLAFKDFAKPYYSVTSKQEFATILAQLPGDMAVVKPERGNSGEGVFVAKKSELPQPEEYPVLVQEFVDSSAGIPGVMQGLHDLRLIFSDEEFLYAYYRTPKAGSFLANVARGGTQTMIPKESIPDSIWPIVAAVQTYYSPFTPKIYTIDFIFDKLGKPWIVELNTMPGLYPDESERPHIEKLYRAIIQALKSAARKK